MFLSLSDYAAYMSKGGAAQIPQVASLLGAGRTLVDEVEEAYKELESNHRPPSLTEAYNEFSRSLIEYRDSVLYNIVMSSVEASGDGSSKIGKSAEWGGKKQWKKAAPSVDNLSKILVLSKEVEGVEKKFEDEEEGQDMSMDGAGDPKPTSGLEAKPKKKKVMKKVVRKVVRKSKDSSAGTDQLTPTPSSRNTRQGDALRDGDDIVLRSVMYYISEVSIETSETLQGHIVESMEEKTARTGQVGIILDSAAKDYSDTGKDASAILGIDDGVISEDCIVPRLLRKLTMG